jgi:tripartite-type tricarboxylate transporter receptor subunit TctC
MHGDKVRVLAETGAKRHPALPNEPAASEVVPGYTMVSWTVLVAPPGTPANVVQKLSAASAEVMRMPEVVSRMRDQGYETIGTSAAEARTFVKEEADRWHKAVLSAGITPELRRRGRQGAVRIPRSLIRPRAPAHAGAPPPGAPAGWR